MTDQSIKEAFSNSDGNELKPLQDAARCRSESDWLVGINGTRAVTIKRTRGRSRQFQQLSSPNYLSLVISESERFVLCT